MKKFWGLILFIGISWQVSAQEDVKPFTPSLATPPEKVKFSVHAGTSFFYSPHSVSGSSFFVTPKFSYTLTPKLRLTVGAMFIKQNLTLPYSLGQTNDTPSQSVVIKNSSDVQTILFAQGDYSLSDKLTLSGSVMKSLDINKKYQNPLWNNSFQAMSMGVNYKISNTVSVGAGIHVIKSNGSIYPTNIFTPGVNQFNLSGF